MFEPLAMTASALKVVRELRSAVMFEPLAMTGDSIPSRPSDSKAYVKSQLPDAVMFEPMAMTASA